MNDATEREARAAEMREAVRRAARAIREGRSPRALEVELLVGRAMLGLGMPEPRARAAVQTRLDEALAMLDAPVGAA